MARKKRKVDQAPEIPEPLLLERINNTPEPYKSYACFCYLFGNRVSEGIGIPNREIVGFYEYPRKGKGGKIYTVKVPKYIEYGNSGYELEPIRAWQLEYDEKEEVLWAKSIPTLKKKDRDLRNVEVIYNGVGEKPFIKILLEYRNTKNKEDYLWTFNRRQAYNNFMKYIGTMPHKLRSMRATKEVKIYQYDTRDLMDKFKWSNANVALHYVQKNPRERIEKAKRKAIEFNQYNQTD